MKKIFLTMVAICAGFLLFAQPKIQFEQTTYDFGNIKEEEGKVTGKFIFTNIGDSTLTLVRVKPGCGCTAANYTKTPIEPGQQGFIEATYNPYGRPAGFNKVIRVTTNEPQFSDPSAAPHNIFIKGFVIKRPPTVFEEAGYNQGQGMIRVKENVVRAELLNSETQKVSILIRNFGKVPTTVQPLNLPPYITLDSVSFKRETLNAGEEGKMVFKYDASKKNEVGIFKEVITIMTQDSVQPKKTFFIDATIKEDFTKYSAAQMKSAPMINFSMLNVNFGKVAKGNTPSQTITITNSGKNDLIIRQLKPSNNIFTVRIDNNTIPAGQSATITVTMNSRNRRGAHNGTIDVISNDPRNSEAVIQVQGEQLP